MSLESLSMVIFGKVLQSREQSDATFSISSKTSEGQQELELAKDKVPRVALSLLLQNGNGVLSSMPTTRPMAGLNQQEKLEVIGKKLLCIRRA